MKIGTLDINNLCVGGAQAVRAYVGTTEVWSHANQGYIYYKTTDNSVVTPNVSSGFGANIVSNTYSGGQGTITFDGAVTTIPSGAFTGKTTLREIVFADTITTIDANSFSGCTSLGSVNISSGITSVGNFAFRNCTAVSSITLSEGLQTLGAASFYGCTSLSTITIPSTVTSFGQSAFQNCSALSSVTISNGVTNVGYSAFYNCTAIPSVTLPNSVTSISTTAFYGCTALTSITIPTGVTQIGDSAFSNCKNLIELKYNGTKTDWENVSKGSNWNSNVPSYGAYCSNGYDPWVTLSSTTMYYTSTNKSTITPSNAKYFNDAGNNTISSNNYSTIGTLKFTYVIQKIPANAFSGKTTLQTVFITTGGGNIGNNAFKDCTNLSLIAYQGTKSNWNSKTKGTDWYLNTKVTVVHCTDGDISL